MNIYLKARLIPILLMSSGAMADCGTSACTNVNVENLYITANSNILVMTSGDESSLNCTGTSGSYVTLNVSDANSKELYSALLSARTTDKALQINIVSGSAGCLITRVEYGKYF